ncbi:MAG: FGGY-family carbohydrate kinase [Oscillospiraceae bacterium]|nr:FGGY-family carbohydrate kinase [Oscillospiraceae bacterium]
MENINCAPACALAIDIGASGGRAVAGYMENGRLVLDEVYKFANEPVKISGTLYWDILRIYHEITNGIRAAKKAGYNVESIGIDTWGVDYGVIDKRGKLKSNPVHYRDTRTQGVIWEKEKHYEQYLKTGNIISAITTVTQLHTESLDPEDKILFIPDLLFYFLTGKMTTDRTILATSGLTDFSRVSESALNESFPLLDDNNIRAVRVAGHDTASAACIIPPCEPFVISGTWSMMGITLPEPLVNKQSYAHSFLNMAGVNNNILIKGIAGFFVLQQCRGNNSYEDMEKAASVLPLAEYLIDLSEPIFGTFCDMPQEIKNYCIKTGQGEPDISLPGMLARIVYDSLALEYAYTMESISALLGKQFDNLHIIGGGACDAEFCRTAANATGMRVTAGIKNASAAGNAAMQLIAHDEIPDIIASSFKPNVYIPDTKQKDFWRMKKCRTQYR